MAFQGPCFPQNIARFKMRALQRWSGSHKDGQTLPAFAAPELAIISGSTRWTNSEPEHCLHVDKRPAKLQSFQFPKDDLCRIRHG